MGTRMAPSYANLFMGRLEESFLDSRNLKPLFWARYIDDIFLLWSHGHETLSSFLSSLNSSFSVSFTSSISDSQITFLDIDIHLQQNKFETSVHIKPTNHEQYLHYNSCHPSHTKRSIPFSLSVRGHRICNNAPSLQSFIDNLYHSLNKRGYPDKLLKNKILSPTTQYIPHPKKSLQNNLNLITTFFPGSHKIRHILRDLYPILKNNTTTSSLLPHCPSVTFKRPANLKDIFKSTKPSLPPPTSSPSLPLPCNHPRCKCCPLLDHSMSPPKLYSTVKPICKIKNVIYRLSCNFCPAFYIGECSTALSLRINNHRHSTTSPTFSNYPIPTHTISHSQSFDNCFKISIIDILPESTSIIELRTREMAHIWLCSAFVYPGLNISH